jgi:glutamate:GABA antiporter
MSTGTEARSPEDDPRHELRRALGLWDLVLLNIVAILNLNLVPVTAASGFPSITLWALALAAFFLPQGVAVAEFAARYPEEGGIYLWTRRLFGDFHGFLSGWCYWTNNIFYIPTLLFYLVGIGVWVGGPRTIPLGDNRVFVFVVAVGLLWLFAALNVLGLGVGKWVNNAGGVGAVLATLLLVVVGLAALLRSRDAGTFSLPPASDLLPALKDWRTVSAFSVICFGVVGLELGPVMGDEIKDPKRTVPLAVLLGGIACAVLYFAASLALLLALPANDISVIQGVLQAFERLGRIAGVSVLVAPVAFVLSLSIAGATSAWLGGSARIPFVAGLDHYLPAALGRVHPRWHTPHVALLVHAAASTVFISMSFIGARVRDAYLTLLELAVVLQLIPFVYLYAGLIKVAGTPDDYFRSRAWVLLCGVLGLGSTLLALTSAFVPPSSVESVFQYELKMILGTAVFLGIAAAVSLRPRN